MSNPLRQPMKYVSIKCPFVLPSTNFFNYTKTNCVKNEIIQKTWSHFRSHFRFRPQWPSGGECRGLFLCCRSIRNPIRTWTSDPNASETSTDRRMFRRSRVDVVQCRKMKLIWEVEKEGLVQKRLTFKITNLFTFLVILLISNGGCRDKITSE